MGYREQVNKLLRYNGTRVSKPPGAILGPSTWASACASRRVACACQAEATHVVPMSMSDSTPIPSKPGRDNAVDFVCVVLQPRDFAHLLALLRDARDSNSPPFDDPPTLPTPTGNLEPGETWLSHVEAAKYLGISKNTLYHYACQQRVECRKLGGRLEYRRSVLDRFKEEQVRPARRSQRPRSIIKPALGSGK